MSEAPVVAIKGSAVLADCSTYGTKAAGLAALNATWSPTFFAVAAGCLDGPPGEALRTSLAHGLEALGACDGGVIVRSSAVEEDLHARGSFDSERCPATVDAVLDSMAKIAASASADLRRSLGFVVQEWRDGVATGHLSNERRVSRESRSWLCEAELPIDASDKDFRFRVDSRTRGSEDLRCSSWEELAAAIRGVARSMHRCGGRFHIEWVWDGERLWMVQSDLDDVPVGPAPGSAWMTKPAARPLGELRLFRRVGESTTPFPKVNHVAVFRECGFPIGDVRVLSGTVVVRRLAEGEVSRELRRDLAELIEEPVVMRTDLRSATAQPRVLSKRTDTCKTYDELERFLIDAARSCLAGGHAPGDLAFLAHRFMVARAGAFGFAQCGSARVRVDATWGLSDSLLFHPHDSFRVDLTTERVERYLRCKTDYIDVTAEGRWVSRPTGRGWDWRPALTDDEVLEIGRMTAKVAEHVGKDIEVMFFVGGVGASHNVLPWFFNETPDDELTDVRAARGFYVGERVPITDFDDLQGLDSELKVSGGGGRLSLVLRPKYELLRSRDFILAVAEVARHWNLPVELEGSQLSHAYYLLDDAGAATRCVNPWNRPDRRRSFGKLVRDLVPVRIERRGELATTYSADREQLAELIKAKTVEEALELYWAEGPADLEELADLLEILQTAARIHGVEFEAVIEAADAKRRERGGFEHGVVLIETRDSNRLRGSSSLSRPLTTLPAGASPRRRSLPTRRVVRLPGGRLVLPLVPPTGWKVGEARAMALTSEDYVRITYGLDEILVHVRPREDDQNRNQLALFESGVSG